MKLILIIENGKLIRNMITHHLINSEYKIITSEDGLIESKLFHEQIPDLVIADLTSIKNEKVELLMQLKNSYVTSLVPFLLITSRTGRNGNLNDTSSINQSTQFQFPISNYYLTKPLKDDVLFTLVNTILNNSKNMSPW